MTYACGGVSLESEGAGTLVSVLTKADLSVDFVRAILCSLRDPHLKTWQSLTMD